MLIQTDFSLRSKHVLSDPAKRDKSKDDNLLQPNISSKFATIQA